MTFIKTVTTLYPQKNFYTYNAMSFFFLAELKNFTILKVKIYHENLAL